MDVRRLLDGLDENQSLAVTEPTHPLAILAGAGSGKTRVLTRRIAYRCLSGDADARHVLAVTFTRKAANELDSRLRSLGLRDLPPAGTFHALAYAQLRGAWTAARRTPPVLLDRKVRLLGRILGSGNGRMTAAELATEIEWAKARLIAPDAYERAAAQADRRPGAHPERIAGWYADYEREKRKRGAIDFDDLLGLTIAQFERDPTFAAAQRWRHRHLFVDEYQDVNPLQERLLRTWLGDRTDLCVVGDPNQAIYGWNGADDDYLRRFTHHHPGAQVVELRDSYRSSPQILATSAAVLALDGTRRPPLRPHRPDGPLPTVVGYRSEEDEANGIARAIRQHHQPGRSWSSQAVLVRTNAQAAVIETALRRGSIPYRLRGGRRFLDDPEVRDLLSRFERMREPLATTIEDLTTNVLRDRADLLAEVHGDLEPDDGPIEAMPLPDTAVGRRLGHFEQIIRLGHELLAVDLNATTDGFPGWLRTVLLDDDPTHGDAVTISSFHAAKGLEWEVVHVAGVEAGYVPITHARTPEAVAEEIRLLYVAVSRASDALRLSWAATRTYGDRVFERKPSPYLEAVRTEVRTLESAGRPTAEPEGGIAASRAALEATNPTTVPARRAPEPKRRDAVEAALRTWRDHRAVEAGTRPTVILADRALRAVAAELPRTDEELSKVAGLGPVLRARHGARLLAIVAEHLDDVPPSASPDDASP